MDFYSVAILKSSFHNYNCTSARFVQKVGKLARSKLLRLQNFK